MDQRKAKCSRYGMFTGILNVGILGVVLGALLAIPFKPAVWTCSDVAALLAAGLALAYVLLGAGDWLLQRLALAKNPLPADLDLSDRAIARERVAALTRCSLLERHVRRLLDAWGAGASGPQVAVMAANQTGRLLALLVAEAGFILVVLVAAQGFAAPGALLTLISGLMVLVALVALARFQLAAHTAGYIESHLLARIGNDTPAAAAADFAQSAGKVAADAFAIAPFLTRARTMACRSGMSSYWRIGVTTSHLYSSLASTTWPFTRRCGVIEASRMHFQRRPLLSTAS